jgi:hypothetical protein
LSPSITTRTTPSSRGNGREQIFERDEDRQPFLSQLADGMDSAGIVLCASWRMTDQFLEALAAGRYVIGGSVFVERTASSGWRSGSMQDRDLDLPRIEPEDYKKSTAAAT